MAKCTFFGMAPVHDPIYGISRSNITDRLKRTNWRTKAICRVREDRCLYVYVVKGSTSDNGKKCERHYVQIHFGSEEDRPFQRDFRTLKEALAYANGDDGAEFGRETRPAETGEFPRSREADTHITGLSRVDGRLQPNFTVNIPGRFTD